MENFALLLQLIIDMKQWFLLCQVQCFVSVPLQLRRASNDFHPTVILLLVANAHILKRKALLCAQTSACAEFCCGDLGSRTISKIPLHYVTCAPVCVFLRLVGARLCEPLCC